MIEILNMHTSERRLKDEAIDIMQKYDSVKYVRNTAEKMVKRSWDEVEELLPSSEAKEKLKAFAEFLIGRKT